MTTSSCNSKKSSKEIRFVDQLTAECLEDNIYYVLSERDFRILIYSNVGVTLLQLYLSNYDDPTDTQLVYTKKLKSLLEDRKKMSFSDMFTLILYVSSSRKTD